MFVIWGSIAIDVLGTRCWGFVDSATGFDSSQCIVMDGILLSSVSQAISTCRLLSNHTGWVNGDFW
jgi:hypothetical protein